MCGIRLNPGARALIALDYNPVTNVQLVTFREPYDPCEGRPAEYKTWRRSTRKTQLLDITYNEKDALRVHSIWVEVTFDPTGDTSEED